MTNPSTDRNPASSAPDLNGIEGERPASATSNDLAGRNTVCFLQAPCEWLDPPSLDAPSAGGRRVAALVQQLRLHIDACMTQLPTAAIVGQGVQSGAWLPPHPQLSADDRQSLLNLEQVQAWLRSNLLAHNPDSGKAEAPTSEQLTRWTVDSLTCTQAAVQNLSPLFEEIETFLSGLPQWLDLLVDAPVQGVEPPPDLVRLFEDMGVRTTAVRMSATEWVLVLCSVAQMLEQRWLAASIVHQTAFSAYIRAVLTEEINKSLEQKLGEIRQTIESDDEESLPFELQWIDRARALGPGAYWGSV